MTAWDERQRRLAHTGCDVLRRPVLVVDDDEDSRYVVSRALMRAGYSVVTAPDAERALDVVREYAVPVLVTDLRMPDLDGTELIAAARQHEPSLRAVVMTGTPTAGARATAEALGVEEFWTKEVDVQPVVNAVDRAFDSWLGDND